MTKAPTEKNGKCGLEIIRKRFCAVIILSGWMFTGACSTVESVSHPIYEDPDTLVRLEPISSTGSMSGTGLTHPVSFTLHQIKILLASISGRHKVGLLGSFTGHPDLPRLLEQADIDILSRPLRDAFSKMNPEETIVFYRAKKGSGTHQLVTSGTMVIQGDNLIISITNFWHPLMSAAFEVGGTDKLHDIRETTTYVRDFPWISVGEQDFAIFFDDPRYQADQRQGALFGFPERTVSIAYRSYLEATSDPSIQMRAGEEAMQQVIMGKTGNQTIAEMEKRIAELEQTNLRLRAKVQQAAGTQTITPLSAPVSTLETTFKNQLQDAQVQLQERVKHLEMRIVELEKRLSHHVKIQRAGARTN